MEANVHARRLLTLDQAAKRMQTRSGRSAAGSRTAPSPRYAWDEPPSPLRLPKTSSRAGVREEGMSPFYALCNDCGRQIPLGSKRGRCESCWKIYEREKVPDSPRQVRNDHRAGLDGRHPDLRAGYERQIQTGLIKCARCGRPIVPGEPWDLGPRRQRPAALLGPGAPRLQQGNGGTSARDREL